MYTIEMDRSFRLLPEHLETSRKNLLFSEELECKLQIQGNTVNDLGMLYDFYNLNNLVKEAFQSFQKKHENIEPSVLLHDLYNWLQEKLPTGLQVKRLVVKLSQGCELAFCPEETIDR